MGKRSRKRSAAGAVTPTPPRPAEQPRRAPGTPVDRRAKLSEAPPPLWAPVPVTEILVLLGMVLAGIGFFGGGDATILLVGLALVSVATLELVIREHFAGYRSHSTLLAGTAAVLAVALLSVLGIAAVLSLAVGVLVFALVFQVARSAFSRRAGGLGFRV